MKPTPWRPAAALWCLATACAETTTPPDPNAVRCAPAEGPHDPLLIQQGGAVLARPHAVVVTFADDPRAADDEALVRAALDSGWLAGAVGEYGVGRGDVAATVRLPDAAPAHVTESALAALLAGHIASGVLPGREAVDRDGYFFLVFTPVGTRVLRPTGPRFFSCDDFTSFHAEFPQGGASFAYAVVPTCPMRAGDLLSVPEAIEAAASRAILAVTVNPRPTSAPAWLVDPGATPWTSAFGPEATDLCANQTISSGGRTRATAWSNAAVRARRDPCTGVEGDYGVSSAATTVTASPGGVATLPLTAWASVCTSPWPLALSSVPAGLDLAVSTPTVGPGDRATLTVHVPASARPGQTWWVLVGSGYRGDGVWPVTLTVSE